MPGLKRFFDSAFRRYVVTSFLATATDFALANLLHGAGTTPFAATLLGCVAGGAVAFALSRGWTFGASAGRALPQALRFLAVWLASTLLNSAGVPALLAVVGSFPVAWVVVRGAVYLGWNYPLARWFVFQRPPHGSALNAR